MKTLPSRKLDKTKVLVIVLFMAIVLPSISRLFIRVPSVPSPDLPGQVAKEPESKAAKYRRERTPNANDTPIEALVKRNLSKVEPWVDDQWLIENRQSQDKTLKVYEYCQLIFPTQISECTANSNQVFGQEVRKSEADAKARLLVSQQSP